MRTMRRQKLALVLIAAFAASWASAQSSTVLGYWREPGGAVLHIFPCDHRLCAEIARLAPGNRPVRDVHNPDPKLRNRPLCGLRIGTGFEQVDPQHARGGRLYDPKSGRTYRGQMSAEGNFLHLRGYVGLPILGRTETWVRSAQPPPCSPP